MNDPGMKMKKLNTLVLLSLTVFSTACRLETENLEPQPTVTVTPTPAATATSTPGPSTPETTTSALTPDPIAGTDKTDPKILPKTASYECAESKIGGALPKIRIIKATYGTGNVTAYLDRECDGKLTCTPYIATTTLGDPNPGSPKPLTIDYSCNDQVTKKLVMKQHAANSYAHLNCATECKQADNRVHVIESTYGWKYVTAFVAGECDTRNKCYLTIQPSTFGGDPAYGSVKSFGVRYTCGSNPTPKDTIRVTGNTTGQLVLLNCEP